MKQYTHTASQSSKQVIIFLPAFLLHRSPSCSLPFAISKRKGPKVSWNWQLSFRPNPWELLPNHAENQWLESSPISKIWGPLIYQEYHLVYQPTNKNQRSRATDAEVRYVVCQKPYRNPNTVHRWPRRYDAGGPKGPKKSTKTVES